MREKIIIQELLSSDQYRNLDYFAKLFQVSSRTVSNDMKYLMQHGTKHGFELFYKRQEGYYIKVLHEGRLQQYLNQKERYSITGSERIERILSILLLETTYLPQETIAQHLQVSKSIIKVDMSKVEERLAQFHLLLHKKAHYGICVHGRLEDRKQLLLSLMEKQDDYALANMNQMKQEKIRQIEKQLIVLLKQYGLNTNYTELKKLDMYLKLSIYLCKKGFEEQKIEHANQDSYLELAKDLKAKIIMITNYSICDAEVMNLARYLKQMTKPNNMETLYDEHLCNDINEFLMEADHDYLTSFQEDKEFKKSLLAHVSLLLDRLHQSISFMNPLVDEISVKYPVIFNLSIKFAAMLEERYFVKPTQDEIGFIATHFATHMEKELRMKLNNFNKIAIICSSGGGSAFLIKLKLETLFVGSNIQTFSLLELDEVKAFDPDIIFTIKQIHETFRVPIILIKELLDDEDIQKIKNMFEFQELLQENTASMTTFTSLFQKDTFWIFEDGNYEDIMQTMARRMEQLNYASDGYTRFVQEREEVLSTIYQSGIAIPHPINMCGKKNMLSMGIIKHDLYHLNKEVKLIFLVNLAKGNLEFHQSITRVLFDVMSDEKLIAKIRKSISYESFIKNISDLKF